MNIQWGHEGKVSGQEDEINNVGWNGTETVQFAKDTKYNNRLIYWECHS